MISPSFSWRPVLIPGAAMLLLIAGCAKPPPPSPTPEKIDGHVVEKSSLRTPEFDANHPDYLRTHLEPYGLAPLTEAHLPAITEHYRFLWERWMYPTVLIEVEFREDGTGTYRAMVWKGEHGKEQWVTEKSRRLKRAERDSFRVMSDRLLTEPRSEGAKNYDGSSWYIELVSGDRHNEICRWSPQLGNVRTFGVLLIEMGIDSPLVPIN